MHHRHEVQFAAAALQECDEHQAAVAAQQRQIPRDIAAADHVQHHVHAGAGGDFPRAQHKILGAVVDRRGGAEVQAEAQLLIVAHGHDGLGADMARQLYGCQANAAGTAVNEHALCRRAIPPDRSDLPTL